jgi:hypothetical protein
MYVQLLPEHTRGLGNSDRRISMTNEVRRQAGKNPFIDSR